MMEVAGRGAGYDDPPPLEEVMAFLATWDKVPKEQLLEVFVRGHFAGVEEMRTNERLFNRVAPIGVNDIAMACQYKFFKAPKLEVLLTTFDGLLDNTIDPGAALAPASQFFELALFFPLVPCMIQ